jgi:hypothetical protein
MTSLPNKRLKRVLVVAYVFPPSGGAGVQRITKFVRYLPELGWDCSVLTVANPSVPVQDSSLLEEIPEDIVIRRAKTLEPGYKFKNSVSAATFSGNNRSSLKNAVKSVVKRAIRSAGNAVLHPDAQVLWYLDAVKQGKRLLKDMHHDAILVTAPPFSAFLVGKALSKFSGLPLILDYRDEWGISNRYQENRQRNPIANWIQRRQQRSVLRTARSVIATTKRSDESLRELVNESRSHATVSCIYNGYDQNDIDKTKESSTENLNASNELKHAEDRKFRLAYVGTLWNLTSIEPVVAAIQAIASTDADLVSRLELVIAGRRTGEQDAVLDRLNELPCVVKREGYVPHKRAIEIMNSADSLSLLLSDVEEAGRVMPAKTFEYMALRKPILNVSPEGEITEVIRDCPFAESFVPSDVSGIANYLRAGLRGELASTTTSTDDGWTPSQYERKSLCKQLSNVLDYACSAANRERAAINGDLESSSRLHSGATL